MNFISPELWENYRRSEYRIGSPFNLTLRVNQPATGLPDGPWVFLTAWNPRSEPKSESENRAKQLELEALLRNEGVRCVPALGWDPLQEWADEECILALGLQRERALELGRQYGQNAILVGIGEGIVELVKC